jgi:hypothetical protein
MNLGRRSRVRLTVLAAAGALAALVAGCTDESYPPTVAGYTTVYADTVPPGIYGYPRIAYGGSYVYLVDRRWYYPAGHRWVIIQGEPPELYRYRTTYVQGPPVYRPAPPPYQPRQTAPPAEYGYPPPARPVP